MLYQTGVILVLISAVCYGFIPIFSVYAYEAGATTLNFLFYRYLVAAIVFFLYLAVRRIKIQLSWRQVFWLFILGGVFNVVQSILFVSSVKYISAGLTTLLFFTHPILVAVLSYFQGEKLTRGTAVAIFISFAGLFMVLDSSLGEVNTIGIALSLGAALFYTGFVLLGNRLVKDMDVLVMNAFVSLFTVAVLFPLAYFDGSLGVPLTVKGFLAAAGCGLVTSNIAPFAFFAGITAVGATTATILSNAEPVTAVVLSALLFSQHLTGMQLCGGLLILVGGTIAVLAKKRIKEGLPQNYPT
ncbi:MAG TPA: EamA family transporter [Peptococcaceae bacterium]|nr:EamA family transporter [Peptococcaceae bacterium]